MILSTLNTVKFDQIHMQEMTSLLGEKNSSSWQAKVIFLKIFLFLQEDSNWTVINELIESVFSKDCPNYEKFIPLLISFGLEVVTAYVERSEVVLDPILEVAGHIFFNNSQHLKMELTQKPQLMANLMFIFNTLTLQSKYSSNVSRMLLV